MTQYKCEYIYTKIAVNIVRFVCSFRLTEVEEYTAICKAIEIDFKQISLDNYGHYFLRKLFEKMPSELVKMFIPTINNSFVELSTSKNGVFIVQCVLKGLSLI